MSALITRTFALLSDPCSLAFLQAHRSRRVAKGRCYNKRDPVNGGDIQEQAVGVSTQQNTVFWHTASSDPSLTQRSWVFRVQGPYPEDSCTLNMWKYVLLRLCYWFTSLTISYSRWSYLLLTVPMSPPALRLDTFIHTFIYINACHCRNNHKGAVVALRA